MKRVTELWNELNYIVSVLDFSEDTCNSLGGHNYLDNELFDLNYKDICVTIHNYNGKCYPSKTNIEVYNEGGMLDMIINLVN